MLVVSWSRSCSMCQETSASRPCHLRIPTTQRDGQATLQAGRLGITCGRQHVLPQPYCLAWHSVLETCCPDFPGGLTIGIGWNVDTPNKLTDTFGWATSSWTFIGHFVKGMEGDDAEDRLGTRVLWPGDRSYVKFQLRPAPRALAPFEKETSKYLFRTFKGESESRSIPTGLRIPAQGFPTLGEPTAFGFHP